MRPCLSVKKYSRFAGESPENLWEYLTGRKGQSKIIRTSNYLKFKEKYLLAERGEPGDSGAGALFQELLDHMFDHIMDLEERALHHVGADDLSVRELHVLDAVGERMADGRNTMTGIADGLSIQVSSLTVAVNTLVRKGYLVRERENRDRRVIRVLLTERGAEASRVHTQFYGRVVHRVCSRLNEEESQVLVQCLRQLDELFDSLKRPGKTGVSEKKGGS